MKKQNRIGSMNESSLHESLKSLYAGTGCETEANLEGYIVDIRVKNRVIEVQTGGFSGLRKKTTSLLPKYKVRVVYPLAVEKTLVVIDPETKETAYRRKSPKKGDLIDIAGEILYIPQTILHPNFSLEVVLTREEEVRAADGGGSWRRRGMSIVDRRLLAIVDRIEFKRAADYIRLLPDGLPRSFTNKAVAEIMRKPIEKIGRLTYSLRRLGLLEIAGREGNANVFRIAAPGSPWRRGDASGTPRKKPKKKRAPRDLIPRDARLV